MRTDHISSTCLGRYLEEENWYVFFLYRKQAEVAGVDIVDIGL